MTLLVRSLETAVNHLLKMMIGFTISGLGDFLIGEGTVVGSGGGLGLRGPFMGDTFKKERKACFKCHQIKKRKQREKK